MQLRQFVDASDENKLFSYESIVLSFKDVHEGALPSYLGIRFYGDNPPHASNQIGIILSALSKRIPFTGKTPVELESISLKTIANNTDGYTIPMTAELVNLRNQPVTRLGVFVSQVEFTIQYK